MSTDKSVILRAFNTHFFEFLDDLISIFPENIEIQEAKTSFDLVKRANPTSIIKAWAHFVYTPYKNVIDEGDITFFFEKNYEDDLTTVSNAKEIMKIIDKIRAPISQMSETSKVCATKYIQNLSQLSIRYPT